MQLLFAIGRALPSKRALVRGALFGVCCSCCAISTTAQESGAAPVWSGLRENIGRGFSGSTDEFGEPGFDLEEELDTRRPSPQVLPQPNLDARADRQGGLSVPFAVTEIVVQGNTVLPAADIEALVAPFEHRELTPEQLQELRRRLSLRYFSAGYINSGVLLPEQVPSDGVLVLQAVEGVLQEVQLLDNERLSRAYLEPRLRRGIERPLNLVDLQNSLRMLELNPLIRQVNGVLVPGLAPGQADLRLRIREQQPLQLGVTLDNQRSPSVGSERALLNLQHLNVSGRGDRFAAALSASEGLQDIYLSYQLPLNGYDTRLMLDYQRGQSEVVEHPFDDLDIESDTESWAVALGQPLIDNLDRKVTLSAGLHHSSSETDLLGRPFSFSLGARDGEIATTSVSIGGEWIERGESQVLALRSTLRYGLDLFDATMIPSGAPKVQIDTGARIPQSRFTVLLTQLQYARRIGFRNSQVVFSSVWQESFDPLLSVEKLAVGGRYSVRGFRENQLVRDNGVTASLEWRVPLFVNEAGYSRWHLTAIPFIDYGRSWDEDSQLSTHRAAQISSVGLGLRWTPKTYLNVSLFYGERMDEDDVTVPTDDDWQDEGFHFALAFYWPFQ
ncbi:MAG: ShlB/FhaC/HecB family hemolysin secretion/activation protein [Parahaliea sp.]